MKNCRYFLHIEILIFSSFMHIINIMGHPMNVIKSYSIQFDSFEKVECQVKNMF